MAQSVQFTGVIPILATPFDEQENLDLESFERMIRFMAKLDVAGVTILGVLGESNRLLDHERENLIRAAVRAADGALPIIVGASHSGTLAAVHLSRMAESLGAAAVMITPHSEATPNDQRVFDYFQRIANGVRIPIVAQDHPASTQVHMSVALLLRLVNEIPSVACIKEEAVPTAAKIGALLAGMKERKVPILTGLGALYGGFDLARGSSGFNTGFAFPEVLQAMVRASQSGGSAKAYDLYRRFLPLIVFEQQPGVAIRKEILRLRGLIATNQVRHPGARIDAATATQLQVLIKNTFGDADITQPIRIVNADSSGS
jgi:4-hydroxy-tetrahydrodipicolinate synthase